MPFHIETRHDLQCKPNDCVYVKHNTGLKWLNKSESFMAVIIKVNPIQIGPFQGSRKKLKSFENS